MTLSKAASTVVASTSNAAGATTRGTGDMTTAYGGMLTIKLTNGATGPTTQCVCNVMVAHNATTPAAGSAGTDWKTLFSFGGGTVAGTVTEQSIAIDAAVMQIEVEFTGNTGQAVTGEAFISKLTGI